MKYKYIGTIVGKRRGSGEYTVIDLPHWLPDIPVGTHIKVGYSEQFAESFAILSWKNKKSNVRRNKISNLKAYVKFIEKNSHVNSSNLNEKGIFISNSIIKKISHKNYFIEEIIGYNIINSGNNKPIGIIMDFLLTSSDEIIIIKAKDDLIPVQLNEDCIEKIVPKKKLIFIKPSTQIRELTNNH